MKKTLVPRAQPPPTTQVRSTKRTPPPPAKKETPPVPAAAPEKKKDTKVVDAAKKAEETMEKFNEEEKVERERMRNKNNQNVLSGEIDWYQYLQPKDTRDVDSCAELDAYNHSVYEHNNAMLPKVNELQKKLGLPPKKLDPPTKYVPRAKMEYEKMLFDESFRVLAGIKYLAKREIYPVRDYETEESYKLADDIAQKEEIARKVAEAGDAGIDISAAVGRGHTNNCTCENRWDGESETCFGTVARLRWKRLEDHHFLRPRVVPDSY